MNREHAIIIYENLKEKLDKRLVSCNNAVTKQQADARNPRKTMRFFYAQSILLWHRQIMFINRTVRELARAGRLCWRGNSSVFLCRLYTKQQGGSL